VEEGRNAACEQLGCGRGGEARQDRPRPAGGQEREQLAVPAGRVEERRGDERAVVRLEA
jgi:hypothetical protein